MTANIPRPEHPFPQMERENWMNLNGTWNFEFDFGVSGLERGYEKRTDFKDKIDKLVKDLEAVKEEADEVEQCKLLNKIFADDFKVREKKNASKKQLNCVPSSSASGV